MNVIGHTITLKGAKAIGLSRQQIAYMVKKGRLERIGPGIYRNPERDLDPLREGLIIAVTSIPHAVISLISALDLYGMTDEIPKEHWLAIPHSKRAPRRNHIRAVRTRNHSLGKTTIKIEGNSLPIYNRERCIVDAFRYLSLVIALKALQAYLYDKSHQPNLQKLGQYARKLRVNITPYVVDPEKGRFS